MGCEAPSRWPCDTLINRACNEHEELVAMLLEVSRAIETAADEITNAAGTRKAALGVDKILELLEPSLCIAAKYAALPEPTRRAPLSEPEGERSR